VVDSPGDNMLAEFASAVDAVKSSIAIQDSQRGAGSPPEDGVSDWAQRRRCYH
jgi:hypothetical protein